MSEAVQIGGGRALRVCDLCGGVDDHPRHVISGGGGEFAPPTDDMIAKVVALEPETDRPRLLRDLLDSSSQYRHMDCCRQDGCPTGACDQSLAGTAGLTGAALLEHLSTLPATVTAPQPAAETQPEGQLS